MVIKIDGYYELKGQYKRGKWQTLIDFKKKNLIG